MKASPKVAIASTSSVGRMKDCHFQCRLAAAGRATQPPLSSPYISFVVLHTKYTIYKRRLNGSTARG